MELSWQAQTVRATRQIVMAIEETVRTTHETVMATAKTISENRKPPHSWRSRTQLIHPAAP